MAKKSAIPEDLWEILRTEYVSTTISIRELAEKHNCSADAIEKRAHTNSWTEQRRKLSAEVLAKADAEIVERRVKELNEFNEQDIKIAKALRGQIALHINTALQAKDPLSPKTIKVLTSALADAQKIGRLALGVSTSNNEHTGANGLPLIPVLDVHFVD